MSNLIPIVCSGLGLPNLNNGPLNADHNELTGRVDGNTDSNNDGIINGNDRNGQIEPEELYEEVFSN